MTGARQLLILIADISGYTKLLLRHGKALAHGQMVISELLRSLLDQVQPPFAVSRLDGDAVIVYAPLDEPEPVSPAAAADQITRWLAAFHETLADLTHNTICRCGACANVADLDLKVVGHSGVTLIHDVGRFTELHGVDVIVAHRLLKNSVDADGYVLLSDDAYGYVEFQDDLEFSQREETYDEIGSARARSRTTMRGARTQQPCRRREARRRAAGNSHRGLRRQHRGPGARRRLSPGAEKTHASARPRSGHPQRPRRGNRGAA